MALLAAGPTGRLYQRPGPMVAWLLLMGHSIISAALLPAVVPLKPVFIIVMQPARLGGRAAGRRSTAAAQRARYYWPGADLAAQPGMIGYTLLVDLVLLQPTTARRCLPVAISRQRGRV